MTETTQAVIAEALADLAMPISALKHHPENPNVGDVAAVKASLARFGQVKPIVVQKGTMYVVAGNHTLKAAEALGWREIAVALVDMEEDDALAFVLADNRTSELSHRDDVALAAALDKLIERGALDGTSYTPEDRDMLRVMATIPQHDEEFARIEDMRAHPENYQAHPEEQIEQIVASLREHGFYRKAVLANDGTILAGHGLVKAAERLGLPQVPVVRLPYAPDSPEALQVLTGDNELPKLSEREDRKLTETLRGLMEKGMLEGTGFDPQQLANLVFVTRPETEVRNFDAAAEWVGLPEFEPAGDRITLVVSFDTEEQRDELIEKLELVIAKKRKLTWSAWWPPRELEDLTSVYYGEEPEASPGEPVDTDTTEGSAGSAGTAEAAPDPDEASVPVQSPVGEHVLVTDKPDTNERLYHHPNCAKWIVPLDGMTELEETVECAECAAVLPAHRLKGRPAEEDRGPAEGPIAAFIGEGDE